MRTSSNCSTRRTVSVLHPRKLTAFMLVCAFFFSIIVLALPAAAEADTITETEAEELIEQSLLALNRVHRDSEYWWEHGIPSDYNTVEKMSAYFHSMFSNEIADDLWMYSAIEYTDENPFVYLEEYPEHIENGKVVTYQVNNNGVLEISDCYSISAMNYRMKWHSWTGDILGMPTIQNITGDAKQAEAYILMLYYPPDWYPTLVGVQIHFVKETDGWKIAYSDYLDVMLVRDRSGLHEYLNPWYLQDAEIMLYQLLGGTRYSVYDIQASFMDYRTYQFVSFNDHEMKLIYHLKNLETGESDPYTAEFVGRLSQSEADGVTWKLVGGSLMELLESESPATGDDTPQTILLYFAAMLLSAMGAHAVLKMRKDCRKRIK